MLELNRVHHGDNLALLRQMPDNCIDAVVTDPPYGLSFMGKRWDYDVPSVEQWAEVLRVLKPGGHLLSFAGTRTQHRMAVNIEDAGFEIRDLVMWVYGSGFPKSLNVGKALDKRTDEEIAAGVEMCDAAKHWQGWGTALKPAVETVTLAVKPLPDSSELTIMIENLTQLEAKLWLLWRARTAGQNFQSNRPELVEAFAIAQWSAENLTSTLADLCGQMDTSLLELATTTSLSIVSSWRHTLAESWSDGSTSTTETKSSTTIDWRTLRFSLSQITPNTIIRACSLPGGFSANATTAESHFNASLLLLQSIRTLSATAPAMSQDAESCRGGGVKPNLDPCIVARKPLDGTVAENVQRWGTGGLDIDGSRVGMRASNESGWSKTGSRASENRSMSGANYEREPKDEDGIGRWPSNLIHDGSDEVVRLFPVTASGKMAAGTIRYNREGLSGPMPVATGAETIGDSGSAARFFYVPKPSSGERDEGCEGLEEREVHRYGAGVGEGITPDAPARNRNHHPTVKPVELMEYLVRLISREGQIVLDPWGGSGTTAVACKILKRQFILMEREAEYVRIAEARIGAKRQMKLL